MKRFIPISYCWPFRCRRRSTTPGARWHDRGVTGRVDKANLREPALLRRVRDRMDREYAEPLDVEALARGVNMSAGHLSRQFRLAHGESPHAYLVTRRRQRAVA